MARFRYAPQACFQLSTAALQDSRLRRGSAFLAYAHGVATHGADLNATAEALGLSSSTISSTYRYLRDIGWAIDIGDDLLFLDRPVVVEKGGALQDNEYTRACLNYALGLPIREPIETVPSPEERRRSFRIISGDVEDGKNVIT